MSGLIALVTIILWPVIPLFWIPVHGFPKLSEKMGFFTYLIPLATWLPLAYLIYRERAFLLHYKIGFPLFIAITGVLLLTGGTFLHIWTGKLLGLFGLIGLPEISRNGKGKLVTEGPFSVVRHPTYLAHTMMFSGVFLITGVIAVGIITIVDYLLINAIIIPLEERELLSRFREDYTRYKNKVPRFFPDIYPRRRAI